jgi:hypothetical protein
MTPVRKSRHITKNNPFLRSHANNLIYGRHHLRLTHKFLRTPHVIPIVSSRSTLHNIYDHSRKTAVKTPRIYQIFDTLLMYESQSPFISCGDDRLGRTDVICAQCVHVSKRLCIIIEVNGTCDTLRIFERRILRKICGPMQNEDRSWRIRIMY